MAITLGLTYEDIQAWPVELTETTVIDWEPVVHVYNFQHGYRLLWPEWVETKTIVWGYAWLSCWDSMDVHFWYRDLLYSRPYPLDSAFWMRPTE